MVELSALQPDGSTVKEHLINIARQMKVEPETIDPRMKEVVIPPFCEWVWSIFWQLCNTRVETNPISFTEIKAWSDLYGEHLQVWELNFINKCDRGYIAGITTNQQNQQNQE